MLSIMTVSLALVSPWNCLSKFAWWYWTYSGSTRLFASLLLQIVWLKLMLTTWRQPSVAVLASTATDETANLWTANLEQDRRHADAVIWPEP